MKRLMILRRRCSRRAGVAVQVAVMSTIILGMGALAVDVGTMYTARTELQAAADSAALAAAQRLVGDRLGLESPTTLARTAARDFSERHRVLGSRLRVAEQDVEFGRAVLNPLTQKYTFQPGGVNFDAVRVTVRRTADSPSGGIPLTFANIFGMHTANLSARASAVLIPRDIAVVIDLSGSMTYDSSLMYWNRTDGGFQNTRDIWAALNGPEPSRPYLPGSELETEYAGDSGPAIGRMSVWGSPLVAGYSATSDTGLWHIRKGQSQTLAAITSALTAAGYTADERSILTSNARDNTDAAHWQRRAGVMLGLASWNSGRPGGRSGGNGDTVLDAHEVAWAAYPAHRINWTWQNFIDYVQNGTSASVFRYRYGLKTYTDFLLMNRRQANQTRDLDKTPQQPLRAVKDAVQALVDTVEALQSLDRMSLEIFGTTARHEVNLTDNYQLIADRLYVRQAGHYDPLTNIGGGLAVAISELTSPRARNSAKKVILLMSDGVPNVDASGRSVGDGAPGAVNHAYNQAQIARDHNMTIYCVSVGVGVDRTVMQGIAAIGGGLEFYATGTPEEYTEQLQMIFRSLGGSRPVVLIE